MHVGYIIQLDSHTKRIFSWHRFRNCLSDCVLVYISTKRFFSQPHYMYTPSVHGFTKLKFHTHYDSTDVDECSSEEFPCDSNANCTNNDGSFLCTCQRGYTGNGLHCEGICTTFYAYERSYIYMHKSWRILMLIIHPQISMSARWIMIVMKRMERALTLMDLISVAVKWDSDSMAMASTAVVRHVYLDVVCL